MLDLSGEQIRRIFVEEVENLGDPVSQAVSGREDPNTATELTSRM
jgi:hypothetical protein